jgi:hypothetical protein
VRWEIVPHDDSTETTLYRVRRMDNGAVLTDVPALLRGTE